MRIRSLIPTVLAGVLALLAFSATPALALKVHAYSFSFGSSSTSPANPEPLAEPAGVAVSEVGATKGDVYVVDKGNNRVEIFSGTGAYVSQFNGSAAKTGALSSPQWIAVDNSAGPSSGDVYVTDTGHKVIDKFGPKGEYLNQITEVGGAKFTEGLFGVAVDPSGTLWVYYEQGARGWIASYSDAEANVFVSSAPEQGAGGFAAPGLGFAVDSDDDLYLGTYFKEIDEVNSAGAYLGALEEKESSGVAVDPATNDVYSDNFTTIGVFSAARTPIERFGDEGGVEHLSAGSGLAVNSGSPDKAVYVADSAANAVKVFTDVVVPDVTTEAASSVKTTSGESSATLNGMVTPDGIPVTSCEFEYIPDGAYQAAVKAKAANPYEGGAVVPCAQSPGAGTSPVAVSAEVAGLEPLAQYDFRLSATNGNGTNPGLDMTFATPAAPKVFEGEEGEGGEEAIDLNSSEPKLQAKIDPDYQETTYRFEYATNHGLTQNLVVIPGAAKLPAVFEPAAGLLAGPVGLHQLVPGTIYYYRVVAENKTSEEEGLPVEGTVESFRAQGAPAVTTGAAGTPTRTTATVSGSITPEVPLISEPTTYHFAYVPQAEYEAGAANPYAHGKSTYETKVTGGGFVAHPIELTLEELAPGTTYDYALVSSNELGTVIGPNQTFTTSPPTAPIVSTGAAEGVSQLSASITGTVDTAGLQTAIEFEFGTTPGAGALLPATVTSSAGTVDAVGVSFNGDLLPATTYYFRVLASSQDGVTYGAEGSFTTAGFPAAFAPATAIPFAPYTSIATLDANEAKEGKAIAPSSKSLTRGEKLAKALRVCKRERGSRRGACERKAHKRFGPAGKKRAKK